MTVLVTGAAGGIGRAIFDALTKRGKHVLAQDVGKQDHIDPTLVGDLCSDAFLDQVESVLKSQCRDGLEAVIAAHGISGGGRLSEISSERATAIMAINFETVVKLWERVEPLVSSKGGMSGKDGTFAVIVSQAGLVGEAGNALYCASKFALSGWMRGLDAQTSVRLRAINPGGIKTPLLEKGLRDMAEAQGVTYEQLVERRYGHSPAGRIALPAEIGQLLDVVLDLEVPSLVEVAITGGEVLW